MPQLILILGVLIGLIALYRFFRRAGPAQIRALFLAAGLTVFCVALFYLAVTGRLPAALALAAVASPAIFKLWRIKNGQAQNSAGFSAEEKPRGGKTALSRAEALEILGLDEVAGPAEIKAAYKNLMGKIHPDREGSAWMAAKLNAARDVLLKKPK